MIVFVVVLFELFCYAAGNNRLLSSALSSLSAAFTNASTGTLNARAAGGHARSNPRAKILKQISPSVHQPQHAVQVNHRVVQGISGELDNNNFFTAS